MVTFPENPYDGQQLIEDIDGLSVVIWTYEEKLNQWTHMTYGPDPVMVYTDQVLTRTEAAPMRATKESPGLRTQRDVNHYLDSRAAGGDVDLDAFATKEWVNGKGYATEAWVSSLNYATQEWTQGEIGKIPATDLSGHVTKQEFTQGQAEQDLEISKLDAKVDQIQGKAGQGKWKYDSVNTNPRTGDFIMLGANSIPTNQWDQALIIKFNAEDAVGNNYDFHRAVEGDVLKVGYELGAESSFAEFQVHPGGNGTFGISRLLGHEGYARQDWRYDVEHFSSFDPAGVATQNYVDEGDQGVKDYVDERIAAIPEADPVPLDDYLSKSGGTMSGTLNCEGYLMVKGPEGRLYLKEEDNTTNVTIYPSGLIDTKGEIRVDKISGQLFTGKQNGTSTFRVYADGTVETEKATPPNAKALTTKGWVDGEIAKAQVPGFVWKYANHSTAQSLQPGEFFVAENDNVYMHFVSECGRDLGVSNSATSETLDYMFSVLTEQGSSVYCIGADMLNFNGDGSKYIRIRKKHVHYKSSFTAGTRYHLLIPGFSS